MFTDIVFPKNNEAELVDMALRFRYGKLILVYPLKQASSKKGILAKLDKKIDIEIGLITDKKNEALKLKNDFFVVFKNRNHDLREIVDKISPNVVFGIENSSRKDFIHHRNSGINHVIARAANLKDVSFGFCLNELLRSTDHERQILVGRMSQNIRLFRKYKVKTRIFSLASSPFEIRPPLELISLFKDIGMHPTEAKKSLE